MTTYFSSDFHIGHKLVSGLREFWTYDQDGAKVPDTEAHDRTLAENWDAVVQPEDTVWILGDMSINSGAQVTEWLSQRPGTKHLVSGNHDRTHTAIFPKYYKNKIAQWTPFFASIQDEAVIEIAGQEVVLSHFPYWSWGDGPEVRESAGPGFQARYEKFRPWEGEKTILVHGHTHSHERDHERSYHVGLDAHELQLVPEQTIIDWVQTLD